MATYKTSYCPNCKGILKFREITYWNYYTNDIGNPIEHCPYCNYPYKTRKRRWSQLNDSNKKLMYFKVFVTITYQSFLAEAGVMAILALLDHFYSIFLFLSNNVLLFIVIVSYFVLLILIAFRQISLFKKYINEYQ